MTDPEQIKRKNSDSSSEDESESNKRQRCCDEEEEEEEEEEVGEEGVFHEMLESANKAFGCLTSDEVQSAKSKLLEKKAMALRKLGDLASNHESDAHLLGASDNAEDDLKTANVKLKEHNEKFGTFAVRQARERCAGAEELVKFYGGEFKEGCPVNFRRVQKDRRKENISEGAFRAFVEILRNDPYFGDDEELVYFKHDGHTCSFRSYIHDVLFGDWNDPEYFAIYVAVDGTKEFVMATTLYTNNDDADDYRLHHTAYHDDRGFVEVHVDDSVED